MGIGTGGIPRAGRVLLACGIGCLGLLACAGSGSRDVEILAGTSVPDALPRRAAAEVPDTISIPYRPPPPKGTAYRVVLEYAGDRQVSAGTVDAVQSDSQLLEIEYLELPAPDHPELLQLVLQALHYRLEQSEPSAEREVELADDRLRTLADRDVILDLRGAQPSGDLTPRKVLDLVFGTARVDSFGNVVGVSSVGRPVAKRFLSEFPLRETIAYARPALPPEPVAAGAEWQAIRYPPSPAGRLGLPMRVRYTLSGVQSLEGVRCAWVVFTAREEGESVPSAAGFAFERVNATLRGEAWIELETSRIRLLRLDDDVRVSVQRGAAGPQPESHRLRYLSRLQLELRDDASSPSEWTDGSERFGKR